MADQITQRTRTRSLKASCQIWTYGHSPNRLSSCYIHRDRSMAHQALIQNGLVFSGRLKSITTEQILNSNQHNIISSSYGPIWRLLYHNLASEMLHPARIRSLLSIRKWVLDLLVTRLKADSKSSNHIRVKDHIQYAMFCLLVSLFFGDKLDDKQIKDIERGQRNILLSLKRFRMLNPSQQSLEVLAD